MNIFIRFVLGLVPLIAGLSNPLSAQTTTSPATFSSTTGGPQAVSSTAVANPDVIIITGRIIDATTMKAVPNAKINFEKFGEELIQASIDDNGNYALALDKRELGEPVRIIFRVAGYKKFIVRNVDKRQQFVDVDVFLQPMGTEPAGEVVYKMSEDPFNPLVIKLQ